jgi:diaminopimelate decarboxylase
VYSASAIRDRLRTFDRAFRQIPHTICYSVKANSNLNVLRLLRKVGCGFDVVSGAELQRVLKVDRRANRSVVFSGVGKTVDEIDLALKSGILLFNVESESELSRLAERAARIKKPAQIALRVNPDVPAETHPYISTGLHQHKFGIPVEEARALYARAAKERYLRVAGVSVHIGSQITSPEPFRAAMDVVAKLVCQLREQGHEIQYVDAGGGLGICYEGGDDDFGQYARRYASALADPLEKLNVHLLLEPGRAIIGAAGVLIASVQYVKTNDSKRFLVVDAAMNDLMRPSLYGAFHEIVPVCTCPGTNSAKFDVVGPVCETGDFLARDRLLPELAEGDLLAVLDVGAYGMALSSNYNSRPRAAEVLVNGRSVQLIRRRESIADLIRPELF